MRFTLMHQGKIASAPLFEAEQDSTWVLLSEHPKGLISCGHYNCYALIVKYGQQVALAHVSNADDTSEFLNDMIEGVSASSHLGVSVYLARSFTGYKASQEDDRQDCPHFEGEDAEAYFNAMDEQYAQIFEKDFALITPVFLTMPHDFLVIDAKGDIKLYTEYGDNEISYSRYKKLVSDSLAHAFFNSSQASASATPASQTPSNETPVP